MMTGGDKAPAARRNYRKPVLAAAGLAAVAALAAFLIIRPDARRGTAASPPPASIAPETVPPAPAARLLAELKIVLRSGDNIGDVLGRHGFTPGEVQALCEQTRPVYDLRRIHAGRELRLYRTVGGAVERLEYDLNEVDYLSVSRPAGRFEASLKKRPVELRVLSLGGRIEDSLILAFNQLGEDDPLALAFAEVFGWDVDFYTELQPGDMFKVIFEKRYIEGRFAGDGNILAAELVNEGKVHRAYLYAPPDTRKPGYYNEAGASLEKEFRRSPIKWARVTSRFTSRRLHPVRRVYAAHYGVDYAAPVGTPVQATADGVVVSAGWNGAAGRMVRLRHKNNYETMYLHLSGFGPGIRARERVKGGDVIGYVGSTGESTGPHVDYRILRGGGYLNPLSARFAPVEPLKPEYVESYKQEIEAFRLLLDDPLIFFRDLKAL